MLEGPIPLPDALLGWTPEALLSLVVVLVLTDQLVHRRRLKEEQQRTTEARDREDAANQRVDKALEALKDAVEQNDPLVDALNTRSEDTELMVAWLKSLRARTEDSQRHWEGQ